MSSRVLLVRGAKSRLPKISARRMVLYDSRKLSARFFWTRRNRATSISCILGLYSSHSVYLLSLSLSCHSYTLLRVVVVSLPHLHSALPFKKSTRQTACAYYVTVHETRLTFTNTKACEKLPQLEAQWCWCHSCVY